eukprot:scaffold7917_cov277-Pinguiococcus_pyrenoidosus.AAC.2
MSPYARDALSLARHIDVLKPRILERFLSAYRHVRDGGTRRTDLKFHVEAELEHLLQRDRHAAFAFPRLRQALVSRQVVAELSNAACGIEGIETFQVHERSLVNVGPTPVESVSRQPQSKPQRVAKPTLERANRQEKNDRAPSRFCHINPVFIAR